MRNPRQLNLIGCMLELLGIESNITTTQAKEDVSSPLGFRHSFSQGRQIRRKSPGLTILSTAGTDLT